MTARAIRFAICVVVVAWAAACSDPVSPGEMLTVVIAGGNGQSAVVGHALANTLTIQVSDHRDRPVINLAVHFRVLSGGGHVTPESTTTTSGGLARSAWTLGTVAADSHRVAALVIDPRTGDSVGGAVFTATAVPGPIAFLVKTGGDGQTGDLAAMLPQPLEARVEDAYGNGIPGVLVTWTLGAGASGGVLGANGGSLTDASGTARTSWTLGNLLDTTQVVLARIPPSLSAIFTANPQLPSNVTVTPIGDSQYAHASAFLADSIGVHVSTPSIDIAGAVVTFHVTSGGGQVTPDSILTGTSGRAMAFWRLGAVTSPDTQHVEVRVADPRSGNIVRAVSLRAFAVPPIAEVRILSGDSQAGDIGLPLAQPLAVRVLDSNGDGVPGEWVQWAAPNTRYGVFTQNPVQSDSDGLARTLWILGERVDSAQVATASVDSVPPAVFTAMPRLPTLVTIERTYDGQTGIAGATLPESLTARLTVTGQTGQLGVRGATADFAVVSGGGSIGPSQRLTDVDGFARASWTVGVGTNTATATIAGHAVGFTATGVRPEVVTTIAAGKSHTCAVVASGETWCWGANERGQLGVGVIFTMNTIPVLVSGGHTFVSLTAGGAHTCALDAAGAAWCWGDNFSGQLGDSTFSTNLLPRAVAGGHTFVSLTAGERHTCGLTAAGVAWCWGDNGLGQVGNLSLVMRNFPVAVTGGHTYTRIAAGPFHTCGVEAGGLVWCWGWGQAGQLGTFTGLQNCGGNPCSWTPLAAPITGVTDVQLAGDFTCALRASDVSCWGASDASVASVPGAPVLSRLATGGSQGYACGFTAAGQAFCWYVYFDDYYYYYGRVISTAAPLPGASNVSQLAGGNSHVCSVGPVASPYAYCVWGNYYGQIGDGTTQFRSAMTAVLFP